MISVGKQPKLSEGHKGTEFNEITDRGTSKMREPIRMVKCPGISSEGSCF